MTYVLGGYQTDFARNWTAEGADLYAMFAETVPAALADADVPATDVGVAHVGNLAGELFGRQAQLGGFVASVDPVLAGLPTSRHEAACAAGGVSVLAAGADLESSRYDVALVVGVELMRNVSGGRAAEYLGTAAWTGREALDAEFPWVSLFSEIADEYDRRWGVRHEHLGRIAEINHANARRNPRAQARSWAFGEGAFDADDTANPLVEGVLRHTDCGRITDGAAAVVLASPFYAQDWARRRGRSLDAVARLRGWGHRTAPMLLADKFAAVPADSGGYLFPHLAGAVADAYRRAGLTGPEDVDLAEVHDCFTITEYVALEHIGLTAPGEGWRAIEKGTIEPTGELPVNPSGGLIGAGHPIGATGVRQVLDASRQVAGQAGDCQVDGANTALTLNVGGSCTTAVSFVVGT